MPKYFLYIDESKDYKNHTLYLGGFLSKLGFSGFEKICKNTLPKKFPYELKSTKPGDRKIYETFLTLSGKSEFEVLVEKLTSHSDHAYFDNLIEFLENTLSSRHALIQELHIFADFTRLSDNMEKTEKAFSRSLTKHFGIPIVIEFKNSAQYRCIQFADLAVGSFRRIKKGSAVCASQSESKTSLHTTFRNL